METHAVVRQLAPVAPPEGLSSLSSIPPQAVRLPLSPDALPGLAGDIVRTIEPFTEADPAALLVSMLTMFGNAIGPGPHILIEQTRHRPVLYTCIVGKTSSGRKGTSADIARRLMLGADPGWQDCVADGLVSGEGLIHHVRDGRDTPEGPCDPGVKDKRLLVIEPEFARVLSAVARRENTLSPVLRHLWDSGNARTLGKHSPERTTGAMVSVLAHVTPLELQRRLDSTETANGFANRFLFVISERRRLLPRGGRIPTAELERLSEQIGRALRNARRLGEVRMRDDSWGLWDSEYERLEQERPGLLGELLARGSTHVRRLSMIYALLDMKDTIAPNHLQAALALWRYAVDSSRHIFGERTGDSLADKLLDLLRHGGDVGLTREELRRGVGNNKAAAEIERALARCRALGLAQMAHEPSTGGRRPERWFAVPGPASIVP